MITAPAPDIRFRGVDYRLAEPGRDQGTSVRFTDYSLTCADCPKKLPVASKSVRLADRKTWLHVACAIKRGSLSPQV